MPAPRPSGSLPPRTLAGLVAVADRLAGAGVELRRETGGGRASARAQAIVARSRIDLTCDLEIEGPHGRLGADFDRQSAWAAPVEVAGRTVLPAPVEEALARALVLGDWEVLGRLSREAAAGTAGAPRAAYVAWRLSSARESAAR